MAYLQMNRHMRSVRNRSIIIHRFGDGAFDYRLTSGPPKDENGWMLQRLSTLLIGTDRL